MKVVGQQAVCVGFSHRLNIFGIELQKVGVVAPLDKQIFAVVAAIVDVVNTAVPQRFVCHLSLLTGRQKYKLAPKIGPIFFQVYVTYLYGRLDQSAQLRRLKSREGAFLIH